MFSCANYKDVTMVHVRLLPCLLMFMQMQAVEVGDA